MQQWEYFVFYAYLENQRYVVPISDGPMEMEAFLERCGSNGWDLVSTIPIGYSPDNENQLVAKFIDAIKLMGILKRPKA